MSYKLMYKHHNGATVYMNEHGRKRIEYNNIEFETMSDVARYKQGFKPTQNMRKASLNKQYYADVYERRRNEDR